MSDKPWVVYWADYSVILRRYRELEDAESHVDEMVEDEDWPDGALVVMHEGDFDDM